MKEYGYEVRTEWQVKKMNRSQQQKRKAYHRLPTNGQSAQKKIQTWKYIEDLKYIAITVC